MRRLGAVLPAIEAAGVRAVCVLAEDFEGEPAGFAPEFWDRELFLDESLALFAAAGGGRVRRGGLLDLLVMAGPGPEEVAAQYSTALGRYYIPPYWALGYHQVGHCPGLLLY